MARRYIHVTEIQEVLYQYYKTHNIKEISRSLGLARNTVRNFIREAVKYGLKPSISNQALEEVMLEFAKNRGKLLPLGTVQSTINGYQTIIEDYLKQPYMTGKQIKRLLKEDHDLSVSMRSLYRYLARHCPSYKSGKHATKITVHLETPPGSQAQVDFGYVGYMIDPVSKKLRKAHAFVMTLSYSRYRYVRFVFEQSSRVWIDCHKRAFEFFGGVPKNILLDNLKAGVITPDIYDPRLNRAYAECERYYGFVADPAIIAMPNHKGRVERSIPIVRQQILAGRTFADIEAANDQALKWCRYEISQEVTRTTGRKPYDSFIEEERAHLLPLKQEAFCCPVWSQGLVHKDCHIVFEGSFYSVPYAHVGQRVLIRADDKLLQVISSNEKTIKSHVRSQKKGHWVTDISDYPEKSGDFIKNNATSYLEQAKHIGKSVYALVRQILKSDSWQQRRKSCAILKLASTYGAQSLEKACMQLLLIGSNEYKMLGNILSQQQQQQVTGKAALTTKANRFLRNPQEFSHVMRPGQHQEVAC